MANLFQTATTGLAQLKNFYQGPIVNQLNEDLAIWRGAVKGSHPWSGQQVIRPLRVRRNQGIGATSDGGTLPSIGRQTTVQATIGAKYNYLRFGITGPMIKASQSDVGSFVRSAAFELEMGYNDLKSDLNRQMSWDGTGDLALVNADTVASTSLVVKGRESTEEALKFLDVGVVFDIYTGATLTEASVEVTAVTGTPSASTATLTLSRAVTCSEDDVIVRANSYGQEIQGLLYALDGGTTSIYGVDRSTYISYQGSVVDNSDAQLSLDVLQQTWNEGLRRGKGKYSAIYSDFDSQRMYQKLLSADKRYVNTQKGDGGFASKDQNYLEFNGCPWVPDKDAPTRIMMLPENVVTKYVLCEMEFCDETGSMYIAQTGEDSFEVRVRFFGNIFNEQPSATALLESYISP